MIVFVFMSLLVIFLFNITFGSTALGFLLVSLRLVNSEQRTVVDVD